jgi:predicted dehydrogenase
MRLRWIAPGVFVASLILASHVALAADKPLRAGIIGCDTSHVGAFTKVLNNPNAAADVAGVKIVAAYPGGSKDIPEASWGRVKGFTEDLRKQGIEICDSIPDLLKKVDVVLLESVDGRPHLEQVKPVFEAGKPVFIDKPVAGTLADAIAIFRLAKKHNVPCFSSSSLRFGATVQKMRNDSPVGKIIGCDVHAPCHLEPHHPDLFWYGVHGVEMLFTVMGTGCQSVTRVHADDTDVAVGLWKDGRVGVFRGTRSGAQGYGGTVYGEKGDASTGSYDGYEPLVAEIVKFFKTGKAPVAAEETIEMFAFMEAADESKRQGGAPVSIETVMKKSEAAAAK